MNNPSPRLPARVYLGVTPGWQQPGRQAGRTGKPSLTLQAAGQDPSTGHREKEIYDDGGTLSTLLPLMNFKAGKGCDITLGADFPRIYSWNFAKQTLSVDLESQNSLSDLRKILSAAGAGAASSAPRGLV